MNWFLFVLASVACWRVSIMLTKDSGPYRMFEKLRGKLRKEAAENKAVRESAVHEGIHCIRCVSIWVGFPIALWLIGWPPNLMTFLMWMGISGGAILIERALPT